jgi:hypothetical protein
MSGKPVMAQTVCLQNASRLQHRRCKQQGREENCLIWKSYAYILPHESDQMKMQDMMRHAANVAKLRIIVYMPFFFLKTRREEKTFWTF